PREAVAVCAAVAVVAAAALQPLLAPDLERCNSRLPGQRRRADLIHRNARVNIFAGGPFWMDAGQVRGARTRVVATAVALCTATVGRESAQDHDIAAIGHQRARKSRELAERRRPEPAGG